MKSIVENFDTIIGKYIYRYPRLRKYMPSKMYLKCYWRDRMVGYDDIDFCNPKSFNEKLQWLKVYNHDPIQHKLVDKLEAKSIVGEIIGEQHIIPTLGVYESVDDIEWEKLPDKFILKCTHDSGGLAVCTDFSNFNMNDARAKLANSLSNTYYYRTREWCYLDVPRKIICEEFMEDGRGKGLTDYKFYCFNGIPKFLYVSSGMDNHPTARISFLTLNWEFAPFTRPDYKGYEKLPPKPTRFDEMIEISKKLAKGHPFIRVDLYEINNVVYFSELTFYPCCGMMHFQPPKWDYIIGSWLQLPMK